MKIISGLDESRVLINIYRRLIKLYPSEFRDKFEPEMMQVFKEILRYSDQKLSQRGWVRVCQAVFPDLIISIIYEQLSVWRGNMKGKSIIWRSIGLTVLAVWAILWGWGLLRAFVGPTIILDPTRFLLGDSFSDLSWMTLEFFLMFGSFIALLTFLIPLIQVKNKPGEGMMVQISIRQAKPVTLVIISVCGAATLLLWSVILASRLL